MFGYYDLTKTYANGGIKSTDYGAKAEIDLPGVDKESIEIKQKDKYIYVKAERQDNMQGNDERFYGKYSRTITVGFDIDKIEAELKNGVLVLDIHAKEESKPKKIEIKMAS